MKKLLIILVLSFTSNQGKSNERALQDYHFKLGYWEVEAKAMKPDQSYDSGSGFGHVFYNNVGVLQDELCIDMQEMPDAVGATMRTFDPVKKLWHITWVALGNASGTGTGVNDGEMVVESFPGEDQHGRYVDQMIFTSYSSDHYKANLIRTYEKGAYKLDCIWCYEAKRVAKQKHNNCGLIK